MRNITMPNNFAYTGVKLPMFEHKAKGLITPQVQEYKKSEYDKNKISLYEYKEVKLLNPNKEISTVPKYAGYEIPSVGLVAPNRAKILSEGGFYEYPSKGQL